MGRRDAVIAEISALISASAYERTTRAVALRRVLVQGVFDPEAEPASRVASFCLALPPGYPRGQG